MEDTGIFGLTSSTMAILIIVVLLILWAGYTWYYGGVTVPLPSYAVGFRGSVGNNVGFRKDASGAEGFRGSVGNNVGFRNKDASGAEGFTKDASGAGFRNSVAHGNAEGFGGIAHGSGTPCVRSSLEGAQLLALFESKESRFEEGGDTLDELTVLVGKLSCFKKDLVSPSFIVEATRKQPYTTSHDVEPIGETTGRCFAKTISPRDLSISLDKWNSRGEALVKKLCTTHSLTADEVNTAQALFRALFRDVSDIARGACLNGDATIAGQPGPRDAHPYEKPTDFGEYNGYY